MSLKLGYQKNHKFLAIYYSSIFARAELFYWLITLLNQKFLSHRMDLCSCHQALVE